MFQHNNRRKNNSSYNELKKFADFYNEISIFCKILTDSALNLSIEKIGTFNKFRYDSARPFCFLEEEVEKMNGLLTAWKKADVNLQKVKNSCEMRQREAEFEEKNCYEVVGEAASFLRKLSNAVIKIEKLLRTEWKFFNNIYNEIIKGINLEKNFDILLSKKKSQNNFKEKLNFLPEDLEELKDYVDEYKKLFII